MPLLCMSCSCVVVLQSKKGDGMLAWLNVTKKSVEDDTATLVKSLNTLVTMHNAKLRAIALNEVGKPKAAKEQNANAFSFVFIVAKNEKWQTNN